MTLQEQFTMLQGRPHEWAVQTAKGVRGAFTTGEYVQWRLNRIFGPTGWSFEIIHGPTLTTLSPTTAYAQTTARLTVRFADGSTTHHDAVGVWPLTASRGKDLHDRSANSWETAIKASATDALKLCADRLGSCFRPTYDDNLDRHIGKLLNNRRAIARLPQPEPDETDHTDEPEPEPEPDHPDGNALEDALTQLFGEDPHPAEPQTTPDHRANDLDALKARYYQVANHLLAAKIVDHETVQAIAPANGQRDSWIDAIGNLNNFPTK